MRGRLRFGITYFHNDIDDLITTNARFTSLENRPSATTRGVEAFVSFAAAPTLTIRGDHTYTEARDNETGNELLRRPKHKASLAAIWQVTGDSTLSLSALHVGARVDGNRDFSIQRLTASPYTVINLVGTHELTRSTTLFGRVENLTDRQYQDPTGFERPGLGIFVGVKVRYDAAP
jgi:vitamin B12 transporter